jgi:hypothetical protein
MFFVCARRYMASHWWRDLGPGPCFYLFMLGFGAARLICGLLALGLRSAKPDTHFSYKCKKQNRVL